MWCSCAGPRTGAQRAPSRCEVQSWESCHDVSETTPRSRSQVRACELQNRQWATPVDLGISSQIVICLLFACDYLRYIVLHLCRTQIMENGTSMTTKMMIMMLLMMMMLMMTLTKNMRIDRTISGWAPSVDLAKRPTPELQL